MHPPPSAAADNAGISARDGDNKSVASAVLVVNSTPALGGCGERGVEGEGGTWGVGKEGWCRGGGWNMGSREGGV